jgi:hypothetical protein
MRRASIFLIAVALVAAIVGCGARSQNPETRTGYDLDKGRDNLSESHTLINDLDSAAGGHMGSASPTH